MSGAFTHDVATRLWLPGLHAADHKIRAVAQAVERYDESFRFARHEVTGDWVVTLGENGHPVFGFGRSLPDPADVEQLLAAKDIKRHGQKIMAHLAREADAVRRDHEYRMSEMNGELAEQLEVGFRAEHKHSSPRIFVPRAV